MASRRAFTPETNLFRRQPAPQPKLKPQQVYLNSLGDFDTVAAANGTFIKVPTPFGTALVQDTRLTEELEPILNQTGLRIPHAVYLATLSFFRAVYDRDRTEAAVIFYWNRQTGDWQIAVPWQEVGGAHVAYDLGKAVPVNLISGEPISTDPVAGWILAGTAHSHCQMAAFWSGTDDANELPINGFHVTFGRITEPEPQLACSLVVRRHRFELDKKAVFDFPASPDVSVPAAALTMIQKPKPVTIPTGRQLPIANGFLKRFEQNLIGFNDTPAQPSDWDEEALIAEIARRNGVDPEEWI